MADLGDKLDEIEGLKDKQFKIFGLRMTLTTLGMAIAGIGSVLGALYGGFVTYQKVEEIASLDLGAYAAQMEQTSNKIETQERLLESIEQNLRDAKQLTYDIEKRVNDKIVRFEDKMDKFEAKVEDTKAELEDKLQKALDNPLSGN
jgi:septal ring factor EnvC (AmiA/AmiB activator)